MVIDLAAISPRCTKISRLGVSCTRAYLHAHIIVLFEKHSPSQLHDPFVRTLWIYQIEGPPATVYLARARYVPQVNFRADTRWGEFSGCRRRRHGPLPPKATPVPAGAGAGATMDARTGAPRPAVQVVPCMKLVQMQMGLVAHIYVLRRSKLELEISKK